MYADDYPYLTSDIILPMDSTGFIYLLVSIRYFDRDYVGQKENLSRRFFNAIVGMVTRLLQTHSIYHIIFLPTSVECHIWRKHRDKILNFSGNIIIFKL